MSGEFLDSNQGLLYLSPSLSECQVCKPLCPKCKEILASPGYQTCTCFTCPSCGRRNTEIMYHTCGKEPKMPGMDTEFKTIVTRSDIIYIPESCKGENYDFTYRNLDIKDKVILEIGAEVGSTASYFLRYGAKRVISVEAAGGWYDRLVENAKQMQGLCEPIHMRVTGPEQIIYLIETYKPDILHMDIEGDEKYLLDVPDEIWEKVPIIDLEVHKDWDMLWKFVKRFMVLCYEMNLYSLDPGHGGWVLTATKMDKSKLLDCKGYTI